MMITADWMGAMAKLRRRSTAFDGRSACAPKKKRPYRTHCRELRMAFTAARLSVPAPAARSSFATGSAVLAARPAAGGNACRSVVCMAKKGCVLGAAAALLRAPSEGIG